MQLCQIALRAGLQACREHMDSCVALPCAAIVLGIHETSCAKIHIHNALPYYMHVVSSNVIQHQASQAVMD